MANGRGTFIDSKGSTYEGDWMDDHQHGMGAETWEQGKISFQGEYNQGKKNGRGRYEWADGSFYEGDFVDSVFQGQGKCASWYSYERFESFCDPDSSL